MPGEETKKTPVVSSPNPGKKFVQTRLPFKILSPGSSNTTDGTPKRKLSSPLLEDRASKVAKTSVPEPEIEIDDNEEYSDPDAIIVIHDEDGVPKEDDKDDDNKGIRIKIPFVKKSKPVSERKRSKKQQEKKEEPVEEKPEVQEGESSSSEQKKVEEDLEPKEKIQKVEESVQEEQEVEDQSAEQEDKDSGKGGDSDEEKSSESTKIFCDEKLSRSSDGDNPVETEDTQKKLTPKQLEKKKEAERRRQERLEEQLRRKKKQEEEKEIKRKEKEEQRRKEKEEREEPKRKEKEEKDEQKRREREEKEKKRLAEQEAKNEEKRQKEEEKRLKEEEKKKKEDEKRKKEEEKKEANKRASDNFRKFFMLKSKPSSNSSIPQDSDKENSSDDVTSSEPRFMPFCVKPDMRLAPITRREFKEEDKNRLDAILKETPGQDKKTYLKEIKEEHWNPLKSDKTWPQEDENDEDVVLLGEEGQPIEETKPTTIKYRVKFLSFHENQRPPYYGTWQKKSSTLGPRKPFGKDQKLFDYEVDSDDEWEEEEPGESLHGSDDEKDKESEDDYEVDNDFFVPHGHLSDEELQNEDENDEDNSPEMQKAKLKLMQQEFADEMKKKTEKLKPRLIGCIWQTENGEKPTSCSEAIWKLLSASRMLFCGPISISSDSTGKPGGSPGKENEAVESTPPVKKSNKLSEEDTRNFIRLVHGNSNNKHFLVDEFQATRAKENENRSSFVEVTKVSLKRKLREVAEWKICPEPGAMQGKMCWYVDPKVREQYGHQDLTLPNSWKYILTPKRVEEPANPTSQQVPSASPAAAPEAKKDVPPSEVPGKPAKKRIAPLMSVPRGQNFSPTTKNQLISGFLKKTNTKIEEEKREKPPALAEIIELD